ncbi:MAG: COX15/CtaA family protein, partial [Acidimicrobiia bacterium]|nr:COX15/CtaA family protein [Acidimicrobiia bacterium]
QPPALVKVGLVAVLVVAAAGAVTALGDTLFPAESLSDGLRQDLSASSSFLVNLRVIHPVLAVGVAGFVIWVTQRFRDGAPRLATSVIVVVGLQVLAGFVNVALLAPVWMQVVHLLLADVLWIAMVLFALALSRSTAKSAVSVNA